MNDTPTPAQIHQAMSTRLKQGKRSKLSLAEAVRACCLYRPENSPFQVGDHTLEWVEAECTVRGGRQYHLENTHAQTVLLLDGRLVDEEPVTVTKPDWTNNHWDSEWHGPLDGWYPAGAWGEYETGAHHPEEKPRCMQKCSFAALREVARALPDAMAAWQAEQIRTLETQAEEANTLTKV